MYKDIPYIAGIAGTTPSALSDLTAARKILNIQKAPIAPQICAVWDPEAEAKFLELIPLSSGQVGILSGCATARSAGLWALRTSCLRLLRCMKKVHLSSHFRQKILLKGAAAGATQVTLDTDDTSGITGTLEKGDILTFKRTATPQQLL